MVSKICGRNSHEQSVGRIYLNYFYSSFVILFLAFESALISAHLKCVRLRVYSDSSTDLIVDNFLIAH